MAKVYRIALAFYREERAEIKKIRKNKLLHFRDVDISKFPLMQDLSLSIDKEYFFYFKKIAAALMHLEPSIEDQIRKEKNIGFAEFKACSYRFLYEGLIKESDQLLFFLLNKTYRPALIMFKNRYGYRIKSYIKENYRDNRCPVCWAAADIGYLSSEDSARILVCPRCDMQWRYLRTGCSVCGTKESESMDIYVKGDKRIYYCKKCGGSLPVIDMREKFGDFNPITERVEASILKIG
ncbi:MAG: formate dehydrogenase accessory protein FdhE [Epsilonproteobacteria bacterium]|nr:formate dehydrogenase accessory protein FdhE [Campylobacterota bacterium]